MAEIENICPVIEQADDRSYSPFFELMLEITP